MLTDITFKTYYYQDSSFFGTENTQIMPKVLGTDYYFNPQKIIKNWTELPIKNGCFSFNNNNKHTFKLNLISWFFGKYHTRTHTGINNLIPMFLFKSFQIIINLNKNAFFVPMFNSNLGNYKNKK